ncbi:serine hydrolase [Streptomyces buecherae]|uniref:Serine hydrolase n=1 Tax=Streptomyces buecherae TaxID=2763006 RepID=A0A7H8N3N5_9ACTN|nr:serine hydrolase [Streptomyces buecherae]QKW49052.1 serine hydrolase [Streptomyces buecherae]
MLIERVTGRTWQQEVTRRVIEPLGLHDTRVPSHGPYPPRPYAHSHHPFAPAIGKGAGPAGGHDGRPSLVRGRCGVAGQHVR